MTFYFQYCQKSPELSFRGFILLYRISTRKTYLAAANSAFSFSVKAERSCSDLLRFRNQHIKDRSGFILIDCNNHIRLFHTGYVLNCTGNTDCKVNIRANGLTGLSNLKILRLPACIYNSTGAAYGCTRTSARSSRSLKFSALPTPRPPDTRILASIISATSDTALTTLRFLHTCYPE